MKIKKEKRKTTNPNPPPIAPPPLGNKWGVKIKDPIKRQLAYDSFCEHIAKGKSIKSWWYDDGEVVCTWQTMLSYTKDEAEFDPAKRLVAESRGYNRWETVVEQSAIGENKDCNTTSLQLLMRNKFGWDKEQRVHTVPNDSSLNELIDSLKSLKGTNGAKPETNQELPGSEPQI